MKLKKINLNKLFSYSFIFFMRYVNHCLEYYLRKLNNLWEQEKMIRFFKKKCHGMTHFFCVGVFRSNDYQLTLSHAESPSPRHTFRQSHGWESWKYTEFYLSSVCFNHSGISPLIFIWFWINWNRNHGVVEIRSRSIFVLFSPFSPFFYYFLIFFLCLPTCGE